MSDKTFPSAQVLIAAQIAASQFVARKRVKEFVDPTTLTALMPNFFQPMKFRRLSLGGYELKPYRVFCQGLKDKFGTEPPYPGQDKVLEHLIELYLTHVGTKTWEKTFKWDDK